MIVNFFISSNPYIKKYVLKIDSGIDSGLDNRPYAFNVNRLIGDFPKTSLPAIGKDGDPFNHATVTSDDVYLLFDEFVTAYPEYVSREKVGESTNGWNMYAYNFNPTRPSLGQESIKPYPKFLMGGAIHGVEEMAVYIIYHFFNQIVNHWENNEVLEYLRHNINFKVMPVQNPEDFTNKQYIGIDDINLNRDFDWLWTEDISAGTGTAPMQRVESTVISDYLFANNDAMCYMDCHVRGGGEVPDNRMIWVESSGEELKPLSALIEKLTRIWTKDYPQIPVPQGSFLGYASSRKEPRLVTAYSANVVGLKTFLWEGFTSSATFPVFQSADAVNINLQYMGEAIISIIKYFQDKD